MKLSQETLNNISRTLMNTIGMDYEEFEKLGIEEQQKLINQYQKRKGRKPGKLIDVMIGYGEHSTFIKAKIGERVMIGYGDVIEAGLTPEESEKRINDSFYGDNSDTPVKRLIRKITRRKP